MKREGRNNGWISVRDNLPGFYNRVEIGRSLSGTTEVVEVYEGEFLLTEFGHWANHNSGVELNLHQVSYWRPAVPKQRQWIGRSRITGFSKEFKAITREAAWELANKWRRENFMVEGELQLLETDCKKY